VARRVVIFGTGEIAELAHVYFSEDGDLDVVAFTADDAFVKDSAFRGLPLVPFSELPRRFPPDAFEVHVALSYKRLNRTRQERFEAVKRLGYRLPSYVCSRSVTWRDLDVGENCFILENQTIQPTVRIGSNVMLWSGNHIGHGTVIRDHAYLASHVVLSGHTVIGQRCFFGVNATVRDFVTVGDDCFITMGALVLKDVPPGSVVLPGKGSVLEGGSEQAERIKRSYFGE
jgi:sugar O-acyltransferase (sialic acid O-acetyltransferase NeuD family)